MLEEIIKELENSDIIWGRYGSDTIEDLAVRILKILEKKMMPQVGDKIIVTEEHLNKALEARASVGYDICKQCLVGQALIEKYGAGYSFAMGDITTPGGSWDCDNRALDGQFDTALDEKSIEELRKSLPQVITIVKEDSLDVE
jgi:hypothetical protein